MISSSSRFLICCIEVTKRSIRARDKRLLRAIMDLGQELESVQQDPVQQEALEYFRDKIITTGPGAQHQDQIELKTHDSNVDMDLYGVMRAIDFTKINETDAVKVAIFFEHKYDNLVYAISFDHMAYGREARTWKHCSSISLTFLKCLMMWSSK